MKKIATLLVVLYLPFCISFVHGQCLADTDDKKKNDDRNIKTAFKSTISLFDWKAPSYSYYISNKSSAQTEYITRPSPFFRTAANLGIKHLQDQIIKDFEPADGWEFVQKNFGTQNDPVEVPWFILYNRYEAMMRVFLYIPANLRSEYTSGKLKVKFIRNLQAGPDNLENAMLSFANPPAKALDKFEKNVTATVLNYVNTDGNYWLYGDFSIAYDPCTCNYFTNIYIEPALVDVTTANLTQESVDINDTQIAAPTSTNPFSNLLGLIGNLTSAAGDISKKGTSISKSLSSAITFLEKDYFPKAKTYETQTVIKQGSFKDDWQVYEGAGQSTTTVEVKAPPLKFPSWMKELPSIGYVIGAVEYFAGGGKSQPTPAMSFVKQKFKITGDLTRDKPLTPIDLYVPGSDWAGKGGNTLSQPKYDNTMGILNLVETPRVKFRKSDKIVKGPQYSRYIYGTEYTTTNYYVEMWDFKIEDDIKYAVNPASGYKQTPVDIKAKLVFTAKAECLQFWEQIRGLAPSFCSLSSPIFSSLKMTRYGNSDSVIIETPLMPLSCIKEYVAHIGFAGNTKEHKMVSFPIASSIIKDLEKDARLQIVAVLEREDNPNANKFTFVAQYKLFPEETTTPIANTAISNIELNPVIENLNLTADKTIRAWETATFKGTINTNGFKLTVIAGNAVNMTNVVNLPPNVDISIGLPTECQGRVAPQSPSQLYNFCAKSGVKKYNPIAPIVQPLVSKVEDNKLINERKFIITPNPFFNQVVVDFNLQEETLTTLDLSNALGQTVRSLNLGIKYKGSYQETIQTADLAPGIYFLTLRTKNGIETKKIVKQGN